MSPVKLTLSALATAALALPLATLAADSLSHSDASFLKDAEESGLFEIQAGKIALQKAQDEQSRTFAQKMIDEHAKANQDVEALAAQKGLKLPTSPSLAQKAKLTTLEHWAKSGFDHHYAEDQLSEHKSDVKAFTKASTEAKDADVKALAAKTLPTLQQHEQMAQQLADATKSATSKMVGSAASAASR